jgi:hypothetical protein
MRLSLNGIGVTIAFPPVAVSHSGARNWRVGAIPVPENMLIVVPAKLVGPGTIAEEALLGAGAWPDTGA